MKRDLLPSIGALIAFESSARYQSFTRAAAELNLTQGAISRQIRQLEDLLGVKLFHRIRQRIVLTEAGRQYRHEVEAALDSLGEATHRIMARGGNSVSLRVAVLPSFGARWLVPRLSGFLRGNADVALSLSTRLVPFDFEVEAFDIAVHYGSPIWAGAVAHRLMDEEMVPVASPAYARRLNIRKPSDLKAATLLHQSTRPTAWSDWFQVTGVKSSRMFRGPLFEQFAMVSAAAVAELGVALMPKFLIETELSMGQLKVLFNQSLLGEGAYYLMVPEAKVDVPVVQRFINWILREVSDSKVTI